MRTLMRRLTALALAALTGSAFAEAAPLRVAQLDSQQVPPSEQRFINGRLEQILETTASNREVVVQTPAGGLASVSARAAISRATGAPCGNCEDQCRPFRYQYQGPGESVFPIVEGVRCRQPNGRWSLIQERVVGSLDIRAPSPQADAVRRAEDGRRAEEQRQQTARQDAARQDAARQDAARQEAARQDAARQETARQETARQEYQRLEALRAEMARQDLARQEAARQDAIRQEAARQTELARQDGIRRDAAVLDASRAEAARQTEMRRQSDARAEAKRGADEAALRAALVRMKYLDEGTGSIDTEAAVGAFLADRRYPLSTPRDRILAIAQSALPTFDRIQSCGAAGGEPVCRE